MPVIVQLNHPEPEHRPPGDLPHQEWNIAKHRRKFLLSRGRWLSESNGTPLEGELTFWGEWEPPSCVIMRWVRDHSLPRFLHRPFWDRPPRGQRQNTDPWVFGKHFRYSNCGQRVRALRNLTPGSIVLFGSTVGGSFVLDTLFVVSSRGEAFSPFELPRVADPAFRICTLESLRSTCGRNNEFTLYRGVTFEERQRFSGMHSFAPCRRADADKMRFCRPRIQCDHVDPIRWKRTPHVSLELSFSEVAKEWERIRDKVLKADCLPGISFDTPPYETA